MSAWKPPRQAARSVAQLFTSRLTAKILPSDNSSCRQPEQQTSICSPDPAISYGAAWAQAGLFAGEKQLSSTRKQPSPRGGTRGCSYKGMPSAESSRRTNRKILSDNSNQSYSVASRHDSLSQQRGFLGRLHTVTHRCTDVQPKMTNPQLTQATSLTPVLEQRLANQSAN